MGQPNTTPIQRKEIMSKLNWNRAIFFAAGTFLGGYVLSVVGGIFGRKG